MSSLKVAYHEGFYRRLAHLTYGRTYYRVK